MRGGGLILCRELTNERWASQGAWPPLSSVAWAFPTPSLSLLLERCVFFQPQFNGDMSTHPNDMYVSALSSLPLMSSRLSTACKSYVFTY